MNREIIAILRGEKPDKKLSIAEANWEAAADIIENLEKAHGTGAGWCGQVCGR